jgi:hypothetical protein
MPFAQLARHIGKAEAFVAQQHGQVINQVRGLAEQRIGILRHRRQRGLDALLAHLLRDPPGAGVEQLGGVAARRPLALARRDQAVQLTEEGQLRARGTRRSR